jgi:phospholipase/carboxylesterase
MAMTFGRLKEISGIIVHAMEDIEKFQRYFFPPDIYRYQSTFRQNRERLEGIVKELSEAGLPGQLKKHGDAILTTVSFLIKAFDLLAQAGSNGDFQRAMLLALKAFRKYCQAQELVFLNRTVSPDLNRYFLEFHAYERLDEIDPKSPGKDTGLFHIGNENVPYGRGSFSVYIPESYQNDNARPVVMALHGGFGHGRDFIWSWIREARSRRFFVIAPSSKGQTWSLFNPEIDLVTLASSMDYVASHWKVDPGNVLLTGISDGGTFTLAVSMQEKSPFSAYAPISCVLPPFNFMKVKGRRYYWVHGALDWMFPLQQVKKSCHLLREAGADITLKIVRDLAHAYPREENDSILRWFGSGI